MLTINLSVKKPPKDLKRRKPKVLDENATPEEVEAEMER
jgi:hypothetical protein